MLRFTIRDLLWLMVVVGVGLAWRAEHRRYVALEFKHNDLVGDVIFCPDDQKIEYDSQRGFHYEPIPQAKSSEP